MFWGKKPKLIDLGGGISLRSDLVPLVQVVHLEPHADLYKVVVRLFHFGKQFYSSFPMPLEEAEAVRLKINVVVEDHTK